jgi:RNA polymerase sigma factor (sigma-70 family)
MPPPNPEPGNPPTLFATTRWTVVIDAARGGEETAARDALGTLFQTYWQPLYRFARRKGKSKEDAEDLVQGFLAHLQEKHSLRNVDRAKGRFRTFMLASFNHWIISEWKHATRQKRGGGVPPLSFDWESAETGLKLEVADERSPDRLFDREWALALLDKVLDDLEEVARSDGSVHQFERLKSCLTTDSQRIPYPALATELNMSEGAVRVAVHRLRKRYRKQLEAEVARTLPNQEALRDEMQALFAALAG